MVVAQQMAKREPLKRQQRKFIPRYNTWKSLRTKLETYSENIPCKVQQRRYGLHGKSHNDCYVAYGRVLRYETIIFLEESRWKRGSHFIYNDRVVGSGLSTRSGSEFQQSDFESLFEELLLKPNKLERWYNTVTFTS